jgi:hypothetical protein
MILRNRPVLIDQVKRLSEFSLPTPYSQFRNDVTSVLMDNHAKSFLRVLLDQALEGIVLLLIHIQGSRPLEGIAMALLAGARTFNEFNVAAISSPRALC